MTTARQLREWAATIRTLLAEVDNIRVAEHATPLLAELETLAACEEAAERQLV
jgi:hypothetical protein